jgi:hypothetical protein
VPSATGPHARDLAQRLFLLLWPRSWCGLLLCGLQLWHGSYRTVHGQ